MPPRGARGAVSEPSDEAAPAAVTAAGPPPDPEGAAKDSADDVAATVEKPPGALGESKGPEPDGGAAEAEGAAEANNTENKADEKAGAVLDQLRDEADSRVKTVTAEPSFASKTLLERFKSSLGCCGGTSGGTSATSGGATGTSGAGGTSAGGEVFLGRFFLVTRHDICDVVVRTGPSVRPSLATIPAAIATRCPLRARLNRGSLSWLRP